MAQYDLVEFQTLVNTSNWGYLSFKRADETKVKLSWSDDDVAMMLCGLTRDDFQKTVPDCKVAEFPELVIADQYEIHWDEQARVGRRNPTFGQTVSLSLKIAIIQETDGQFAGLVTLHISGMS